MRQSSPVRDGLPDDFGRDEKMLGVILAIWLFGRNTRLQDFPVS